jgi:hypothetical protein
MTLPSRSLTNEVLVCNNGNGITLGPVSRSREARLNSYQGYSARIEFEPEDNNNELLKSLEIMR